MQQLERKQASLQSFAALSDKVTENLEAVHGSSQAIAESQPKLAQAIQSTMVHAQQVFNETVNDRVERQMRIIRAKPSIYSTQVLSKKKTTTNYFRLTFCHQEVNGLEQRVAIHSRKQRSELLETAHREDLVTFKSGLETLKCEKEDTLIQLKAKAPTATTSWGKFRLVMQRCLKELVLYGLDLRQAASLSAGDEQCKRFFRAVKLGSLEEVVKHVSEDRSVLFKWEAVVANLPEWPICPAHRCGQAIR